MGYVFGGGFTFAAFVVIWSVIWALLYHDGGTPHIGAKITSATLPLVFCTIWYIWLHPEPDYTLMIPILPSDIHFYFATAITGTVLFPLYSIALNKYFYPKGRSWLRYLGIGFPVAAVGAVTFTLCYSLLPAGW